MTTPTRRTPRAWRGPCADDPAAWDLDAGTLPQWRTALRACQQCPMLDACRRARDEFWPNADPKHPALNPRGVILAGVAYSETGRVLTIASLLRLDALRRNRQKATDVAPRPMVFPSAEVAS